MKTLIRYGGSYLVEDLLHGRMGVSDARGFNDPFEFHFKPGVPLSREQAVARIEQASKGERVQAHYRALAASVGEEQFKRALKENFELLVGAIQDGDVQTMNGLREQIFTFTDEVAKVVCCTEPVVDDAAENAMWAYYSGNHWGVRLHLKDSFYTRLMRWFPMHYDTDPPAYEAWALDDVPSIQDFVIKVLKSKSPAWRHEREVRLLIPLHETFIAPDFKGEVERCYTRLMPTEVARVDLGIRYENADAQADKLSRCFPEVEIYRASKSPDSYRIGYDRLA